MAQFFRARRGSHSALPGHDTASNSNGFHHTAGGTARDAFAPLRYTSSYLPTSAPRYASGASHFATPPPLSGEHRYSSNSSGSGQIRELHHDHDLHAGAEPGINPLSGESAAEYGHFKQNCVIDVIDYDCDDVVARRFDNAGFLSLLKGEKPEGNDHHGGDDAAIDDDDSVSLPPRMVRWINIGGIDWDILSGVAVKYNLHSLTLEDILHEQGHTHSKADYYPGHLFIRVLSHTLNREHHFKHHSSSHHQHHSRQEHHAHNTNTLIPDINVTSPTTQSGRHDRQATSHSVDSATNELPTLDLEGGGSGSAQAQDMEWRASEDSKTQVLASPPKKGASKGKNKSKETDNMLESDSRPSAHPHMRQMLNFLRTHLSLRKRMTALSGFGGPDREKRRREVEALKQSENRVVVDTRPIFVYLLPDGTVISLQSAPSLDYTAPITERLHRPDSVLRTSEDASLLVESLLDLVVDRVLEVVDEYQAAISRLERDILLYPVMHSVRALHILSGDLIMHKRTLQPIQTMITGLRQYDLERCRAVADNVAAERRFMLSGDDSETDLGGTTENSQGSDAEEDNDTDMEALQTADKGDEVAEDIATPPRGRRAVSGSPASASSLTPIHHHSSPDAQHPSTSSSTTAGASRKASRDIHAKDYVEEDDTDPQERTKRSRKKDKKKKKKKHARVVVDPPPAYDVKAKAQRRRQRKRAWLRAERSRPLPGEHTATPAHGAFSPEGSAGYSSQLPPYFGIPGSSNVGPQSPQSPSEHYYYSGAQYHDERGYMSPLHRQWRQSHSTSGYVPRVPPRAARRAMMYSAQRPPRVVGYFSYKSKVYLADVTDHMDFALTSLETFAGITENLIDYAFNTASYDMNIVMNRLTLVTIIFLPLTLMTGYFGMNFTPFWSVDKHSDLFFWTISIPVMALLVPLFMLDEIRKGIRYLQRRADTRQATRYHNRR